MLLLALLALSSATACSIDEANTPIPVPCRATFCKDREELSKDPNKLKTMMSSALTGWSEKSVLCAGWVLSDISKLATDATNWAAAQGEIIKMPKRPADIIPITEQLIAPVIMMKDDEKWKAVVKGINPVVVAQAMTHANTQGRHSEHFPSFLKALADSDQCQKKDETCDQSLKLIALKWPPSLSTKFTAEVSNYPSLEKRVRACITNEKGQ